MSVASGGKRGRPALTDSARADAKRREIVARAAELFDTEGFGSTTMERIAAAVGLRKSSLYHYFKSRDSVLYAIHDEFIELLVKNHERRAETGDWTTDQLLEEIMADICQLMETHRGHVRVFFEHHRELSEQGRAAMRAKRDRYYGTVQGLLADGVRAGYYVAEPRLAAFALFGMCNWVYQWYEPGELTPRDVATEFWRIFRTGIATPD